MKEKHLYHGHSIDLDLCHIARLGIRWTYFIDGCYCIQGAPVSASVESVRVSALALAHRSVDVLESMKAGNGGADVSRPTASSLMAAMTIPVSPRIVSPRTAIRSPDACGESIRIDDSRQSRPACITEQTAWSAAQTLGRSQSR